MKNFYFLSSFLTFSAFFVTAITPVDPEDVMEWVPTHVQVLKEFNEQQETRSALAIFLQQFTKINNNKEQQKQLGKFCSFDGLLLRVQDRIGTLEVVNMCNHLSKSELIALADCLVKSIFNDKFGHHAKGSNHFKVGKESKEKYSKFINASSRQGVLPPSLLALLRLRKIEAELPLFLSSSKETDFMEIDYHFVLNELEQEAELVKNFDTVEKELFDSFYGYLKKKLNSH